MPDMAQKLRDAYQYFEDWDNKKNDFEALLAEDVVWIETDADLSPGRYAGKAEVMGHVGAIRQALAQSAFVSVEQQGQHWRATDDMEVQGHGTHRCVTDVIFDGDLIAEVRHCLGHGA
jgi:hypothetical protein